MTIHSLNDLRIAWSTIHPETQLAEPKEKTERPRKCRFCGNDMEHITGTNIFVCHGELKFKNADGEEETKPCENLIMGKAR